MIRNLLSLCLASSVSAASWYASTLGSGDGSIGNPWSISVALTNVSVSIGDTLYLRGGTYAGSGFDCSLSGVTVRSYPGEWAVLTDGPGATLLTTLGPATGFTHTNVVIAGSETWPVAHSFGVGGELFLLEERTTSLTNWDVVRGWGGTPPTNHISGDTARCYGFYILNHLPGTTNVVFRDFEITSSLITNRVWTYSFSAGSGLNMQVADKAINLIIHDVAQPGISPFVHVPGGWEINGTIIWGVGMFDTTGGFNEYRGAGVYAQNYGGGTMATIKNCIFFRQTTDGAEIFGETGPIHDFQFLNCASAMHGRDRPFNMFSGSTPTSNTWMNGCVMMGTPAISYVSKGNQNQYVINNTIVNGGWLLLETTNSVLTNNLVFMTKGTGNGLSPVGYLSTTLSSNILNLTWDYNTYYVGSSSIKQFLFTSGEGQCIGADGSGHLAFTGDSGHGWNLVTPNYDTHSTSAQGWPTNYLSVTSWPLDYNSNRRFVTVISTSGQTNISISLGTNGFGIGDLYTLRDAQNYFTVIASGAYAGTPLNLPLNLTNIAALQGNVTNFVPQHTDVANPGLFNVFVLDRTPGATMNVTTLNVGTIK